MIAGIFHQGSGLGNQLHRYVATRVLAADKGVGFAMIIKGDFSGKKLGFKGKDFMQINEGEYMPYGDLMSASRWVEKKVVENGVDIRSYDPEFNFIEDNTVIDGEFQDPRYFEHRMDDVAEWLKTEPMDVPDDLCMIGFRGGEYTAFPDLFLTKEYWDSAIEQMKRIDPNMRFQVHTDDPATARQFFPDYEIIQDIGVNWRSLRYAKRAIIANSSFYIFPRLLAHHEFIQKTSRANPKGATTIAPRYWARRNTKTWALPSNYYKQFNYI